MATSEQALALWNEGKNLREIAEALGMHRQTVQYKLQAIGIDTSTHGLHHRDLGHGRWEGHVDDEILKSLWFKEGLSVQEITDKLGVDRHLVTRHLRKLGIDSSIRRGKNLVAWNKSEAGRATSSRNWKLYVAPVLSQRLKGRPRTIGQIGHIRNLLLSKMCADQKILLSVLRMFFGKSRVEAEYRPWGTSSYIDVALPELKIGIEIDDPSHFRTNRIAEDAQRTEKLEVKGWKIIRFRYGQIVDHLEETLDTIFKLLGVRVQISTSISPQETGVVFLGDDMVPASGEIRREQDKEPAAKNCRRVLSSTSTSFGPSGLRGFGEKSSSITR